MWSFLRCTSVWNRIRFFADESYKWVCTYWRCYYTLLFARIHVTTYLYITEHIFIYWLNKIFKSSDIPTYGPTIKSNHSKVHMGAKLSAECFVAHSDPHANISWLINDEKESLENYFYQNNPIFHLQYNINILDFNPQLFHLF